MNYKEISERIELEIESLFEELRSGISEREDSRAFGNGELGQCML
jgi:hypothetical protein